MKYLRTDPVVTIVTLVTLLFVIGCEETIREPTARYTLSQLQENYQQLQDLIRERHPGTFTDWREFDSTFDSRKSLLRESMDVIEFHRVIAPAVASVRCGHTRLSLPDPVCRRLREHGRFLPLDLRAIGESLFVFQSFTDEAAITRGSAVLGINGETAGDIIMQLKDCMWSDGVAEGYKYYNINLNLRGRYLLSLADPEQFEITYVKPGGVEAQTTIVSAKSTNMIRQYRAVHNLEKPSTPVMETSFSDDGRYGVLTIRFFDYDDADEYRDRVEAFFSEITARQIRSVVLDLRQNDGGDPNGAALLLRYLIDKPFQYFTHASSRFYDGLASDQEPMDDVFLGDLYVLVDGGCFSTTGHLCALLRYHKVGTFIGTETGGSYICNGAYKEYELDNTGITLLVPHTTFAVAVEGLQPGNGIALDYEVRTSILDLIAGRDPVLAAAVALIHARQ